LTGSSKVVLPTRELSVFALSTPASDREAAALAISENRANLVGGISLSRQPREVETILMDLWRRQTDNFAIALACNIVDQARARSWCCSTARGASPICCIDYSRHPIGPSRAGLPSNPHE
jgi:hypothetical protein